MVTKRETRNPRKGKGPEDRPEKKRFRQERQVDPADWGGVNGELLREVIGAVTASGGALRFGYTSDGGAYALGIYGDGDPYTEYIRPSEDIEAVLRELIEYARS